LYTEQRHTAHMRGHTMDVNFARTEILHAMSHNKVNI
jgi:hypothetical protein